MKLRLLFALPLLLCLTTYAQKLRPEVFELLNLFQSGLEKVREAYYKGDTTAAAVALLDYYRSCHKQYDVHSVNSSSSSLGYQAVANYAMQHIFYVHEGFLPPFFYGEDINWQYWPIKDNELRWQLHRHKWFTPMGKMFKNTGDEKYAAEWVRQYLDWIAKNPQDRSENAKFAWRALEVSHRVADQINQFNLFLDSEYFTPEFLTEFLLNYYNHVEYLGSHLSAKGNHLLFQAVRLFHAGVAFSEFKDASIWREEGIKILNREIRIQIYDDGCQFELCPHYHLACIGIFYNALDIAKAYSFLNEFPQSYKDTVEKMIDFYINICFPDNANPNFSDARNTGVKSLMSRYKKWVEIWPENELLQYKTSLIDHTPKYLSKGFPNGGFFVFRNSWKEDATQMVVKAGPPGEWHCQPDNGTFELWYKGHRIFQDSGSYTYAGDDEIMKWRNLFRSSCFHNTVTLDYRDFETTDSKTVEWKSEGKCQKLVTENDSYKDFHHRRTILFLDKSWFIILDEISGEAVGTVNLNYQMPVYQGDFAMKCFCPDYEIVEKKEQGWLSEKSHSKIARDHISYNIDKTDSSPVRFISVIIPGAKPDINIAADIKKAGKNNLKMTITADNGYNFTYKFPCIK